MNVYLDNAATTKMHPRVLEKMMPYLTEQYGNASSIHSFGRKSRVAIEDSREFIADFISADPSEIYFTSCGTEATNFIINGIAKTEYLESGKNRIVTSAGDHKATLNTIEKLRLSGFQSTILDLDEKFDIIPIAEKDTSLSSIVHVNNETGTINDIKEINSSLADTYIHTDAVQSFGKIKIDVKELGIHSLSASAHKLYGSKGIGLAYIKSQTPMDSLLIGGGQERNRRAGTENVASIVGFAEAVKLAKEAMTENYTKVAQLKNELWNGIIENGIKGVSQNSSKKTSPYILSITFLPEYYNIDSEAMLMFLDINGIAASSGSACASGTIKPSHVILAGGYTENYANGTLRFSFSAENTSEEIDYTVDILTKLADKFKK
ncbi:MAG: cysteine desulfurase [Melioribacteraceae bacterium]|nr:cysteine desulfurase [Melioribacteraceae bacterium]